MLLDKFSLDGQVSIVTGGGQGLGKTFGDAFSDVGADIIVAEINPQTGPKTVTEVVDKGRRALFIETDVAGPGNVQRMVDRTLPKFGKIDFLMNNADITIWDDAQDVTLDDWHKLMKINLDCVFFCEQTVSKHMIERRQGRIINIASMSGLIANRPQEQASYNTSKAALIHLTKSLAAEWAPYNIRVNALAPGYMATDMAQPFFDDPRYGGIWMDAIPMKRPGQPDELGPAAVFLASEASSYVTGETLVIDGGYTL